MTITSCKKAIEIGSPVNSITTSQAFGNDANANSSISAIYSAMANTYSPNFSSGGITISAGLAADELSSYISSDVYDQFERNNIQSNNSVISNQLWQPAYFTIYQTNSAISALNISNGVHDSVKNELIGEAKFIRAYCYFYLTNLFGDVPLVLTTDYNKVVLMSRTSQANVYQQIVADLTDAKQFLLADYSISGGQRIRPNKWAASALLARVYLYQKKWADAVTESSAVINNSSLYTLEDDLTKVFHVNSKEAIFQLQQNYNFSGTYATIEGSTLLPLFDGFYPSYKIVPALLNTFENGDLRRQSWVKSTIFSGDTLYYPYKYRVGSDGYNGPYTEYYMVLRLAEQFLIRAEALAQQNDNLGAAINDLNVIRRRANLIDLSLSLVQEEVIDAVSNERRLEFFSEWGHRWLDLKRTGKASSVLSLIKGFPINENDLLFPIPFSEISTDPHLTQNSGY